jgi:hypothetical protein
MGSILWKIFTTNAEDESSRSIDYSPRCQSRQHSKHKVNMMTKNTAPSAVWTPMTAAAASRIQSSTAHNNGGRVSKGSFAARVTSAAARNSGSKK